MVVEEHFHEGRIRSIAKAVSYRLVSIFVDMMLIYALTRRVDLTVGIAIATNIISTFVYYFHERAWNATAFGKGPHHK